jgi:predicted small metal-binding protein
VAVASDSARVWQVTCVCGWRTRRTRDEVVAAVRDHALAAHGLAPTDEEIMAQAVPDGPR